MNPNNAPDFNAVFGNIDLSLNKPAPDTISAGFPVISYPSIESVADQQQTAANLTRSASFKGEQNINGTVLVKDNTGVTRVLAGYEKDGFGVGQDYGLKVSQNGFDASSATDSQLVMSSGFNLFKIVQSGTMTVTPATIAEGRPPYDNTPLGQVAHNLGFVPAFLVYYIGKTGSTPDATVNANLPISFLSPNGAFSSYTVDVMMEASADTVNLYVGMAIGPATPVYDGPYQFKYFIMAESLGS